MKATCIKWDTEENKELREQLPKEIELPDEIVTDEDGEIDYDGIDDYLSDEIEFCHEEYVLENS